MCPSLRTGTRSTDRSSARYPPFVWMFACLPFFDACFNQISNSFNLSLGQLSLLQVVRGGLVVLYVFLILSRLSEVKRRMLPALAMIALGILMLFLVSSRDALYYGNLTVEALVSYFQVLYWLLTWAAMMLVCQTARDGRLVLCGVAAGAVVTAISVILGIWLGGLNAYEIDNVTSSSGWFNSPKNITAILVIGSVLCTYLLCRRPVLAVGGACVCATACVVTYARTGAVALAATLLWLCFWRLTFGRSGDNRWAVRFIVPLLIGGLAVLAVVGPRPLFSRWGDFSDSDKVAGSGRASFWLISIHAYEQGDLMEKTLGNGYEGMVQILWKDYGDDIKHTHNDLLDMLMVGGVTALTWFLLYLCVVSSFAFGIDPRRPEFAVSIAVLLTYTCHGLFTGQIFSTDASTCYLICLTCLRQQVSAPSRLTLWERRRAYLGATA